MLAVVVVPYLNHRAGFVESVLLQVHRHDSLALPGLPSDGTSFYYSFFYNKYNENKQYNESIKSNYNEYYVHQLPFWVIN